MVQRYLDKLIQKYETGDASERSYYSTLENLLTDFSSTDKGVTVLIESRNSAIGIPDFRVDSEKGLLLGYIEAKDLGRDLDRLTKDEQDQVEGYKEQYPKLIVTNFIEFRLFEEGKEVGRVKITEEVSLKLLKPILKDENLLLGLLERFFSHPIKRIYTAKRLAELLARKTHVLKGLVAEEINLKDNITTSTEELLQVFRKTLRPDIEEEDFADMYAQTITYGLFSARLNAESKEFNRIVAYDFIPQTIQLLKKIFFLISGQDIPQHIKWQADEIAEILANTDIDKIQEEFFSQGKGRDPIIHFYETFLANYDPKEREKRGVYYTPEPVVSYITRSVHKLLQYKFAKRDGFADSSVNVLDPAAGTLTFLANAVYLARKEYVRRYGDGGWASLVKDHILENFYAFELLMAPYTVGHLKISLLLKEFGYKMEEEDRFKLYLTNTLDFKESEDLPLLILAKEITDESRNAYHVKTKEPIMVVLGNPPYSVSSSNKIEKGTEFYDLYESYKEVVRTQERNIQPLSDDYIKFIAFAHWKIKQTGQGIVGFITNNSYLDGLIHRDMRKKLFQDFNEIYILNLHGSLKKREKTPEGGKDENVFDIQQGVSIILLVKNNKFSNIVKYADLYGLRKEKYDFLDKYDVYDTEWRELNPKPPDNIFTFKEKVAGEDLYSRFTYLPDILKEYSSCITTGNDRDLVGFNMESVISGARRILNFDESSIKPESAMDYAYKPLDKRYVYFDSKLIQRPRLKVMNSMVIGENKAFILMRKIVGDKWNHIMTTENLADKNFYGFQSYIFPLYFYNNQQTLLDNKHQQLNIIWSSLPHLVQTAQPFTSKLTGSKISVGEAIFYYIYAILYSNTYRQKYNEFLKIDFPKIPFTQDYELFKALAQRGEQLSKLHLLKSKDLESPIAKFYRRGSCEVKKVKFIEADQVGPEIDFPRLDYIDSEEGGPGFKKRGIVIINEENQFFGPINEEVWNYHVGGYQVLDKWLKSRKDRLLSQDEIKNFCKMVASISKTIEIQKEIDRLYPQVEESLTS